MSENDKLECIFKLFFMFISFYFILINSFLFAFIELIGIAINIHGGYLKKIYLFCLPHRNSQPQINFGLVHILH
jgi:hypothetical protein